MFHHYNTLLSHFRRSRERWPAFLEMRERSPSEIGVFHGPVVALGLVGYITPNYPHAAPRRHWARRWYSAGSNTAGHGGATVDHGPKCADIAISWRGRNDTELHGSIKSIEYNNNG